MYTSKDEGRDSSVALNEDERPDDGSGGNVKVMCRFRPLNSKEAALMDSSTSQRSSESSEDKLACEFHPNKRSVTMKANK